MVQRKFSLWESTNNSALVRGSLDKLMVMECSVVTMWCILMPSFLPGDGVLWIVELYLVPLWFFGFFLLADCHQAF